MSRVPLSRIRDNVGSTMHKLIFEVLTRQVGIEELRYRRQKPEPGAQGRNLGWANILVS